MPITSINKVVSMFLVGGLALVFFGVINAERLLSASLRFFGSGNGEGYSWAGLILLTVVASPLAAFLGLLVDGTSHLTTYRLVKWIAARESRAAAVGQGEDFRDLESWRRAFRRAAEKLGKDSMLPDTGAPYATGLLFKTGSSEVVNWAIGHYATHLMSSNFATVVIVSYLYTLLPISGMSIDMSTRMMMTIGTLGALYILVSASTGARLYSYSMAYRHATIELLDRGTCEFGLIDGEADLLPGSPESVS